MPITPLTQPFAMNQALKSSVDLAGPRQIDEMRMLCKKAGSVLHREIGSEGPKNPFDLMLA